MSAKRLKLTADNPTEKRVLDYLQDNASDVLAEKINAGKKTLGGALTYAASEARKMAKNAGCICIEDNTVFGWVIHFFEEDDIQEEKAKPAAKVPGAVKKPARKQKVEKEKRKGPLVLDLFTGEEVSAI